MTNQHPITPPPELRRQWLDNDDFPFVAGTNDLLSIAKDRLNSVMDQAARWGADQELEACAQWVEANFGQLPTHNLHQFRRPKAPSLKEQAFQALCRFQAAEGHESCTEEEIVDDFNTIRRALEALDD